MSNGVASIGSKLAFSIGVPASVNVSGYAALSWTESNEEVNIGDIGPENTVITYDTVGDGAVNKRMGATNNGQQNVTVAFDADNGGQEMLRAAARSKVVVRVRETLATGDIYYYDAYVQRFKTMVGGAGDYLRADVTLEIDATFLFENAA